MVVEIVGGQQTDAKIGRVNGILPTTPSTGTPDAFIPSFDQIGTVLGRIPLLRLRSVPGMPEVKYSVTQKFMQQVVDAGPQEGVDLFVAGDPDILAFRKAATSGFAIEMLLNPPKNRNQANWDLRVMWTEAARSVIGRALIVQNILVDHALKLSTQTPGANLRLLSIASGWGRVPLDVMSEVKRFHPGGISALFVDADPEAVAASQKLAQSRNLTVEVKHANFLSLRHFNEEVEEKANLEDCTGLGDYLDPRWFAHLFAIGRKRIADNGIMVVTNIISDRERSYLDVVWGKMYRRTPEEIALVAIEKGFDPTKTTLLLDPTETMCTIRTEPLLSAHA